MIIIKCDYDTENMLPVLKLCDELNIS